MDLAGLSHFTGPEPLGSSEKALLYHPLILHIPSWPPPWGLRPCLRATVACDRQTCSDKHLSPDRPTVGGVYCDNSGTQHWLWVVTHLWWLKDTTVVPQSKLGACGGHEIEFLPKSGWLQHWWVHDHFLSFRCVVGGVTLGSRLSPHVSSPALEWMLLQ